MAYSPNVPADNLYLKDIPSAIREKGKELKGDGDGYPPIVNADKVDGFDASQTPGPNTIVVTDEDGHIPIELIDLENDIVLGNGLEWSGDSIAMEMPGTCTVGTTNAFPAGGGHTHAITFPTAEEIGASAGVYAFYENFALYEASANTTTYALIKTFTIPIPAAGVYLFDAAFMWEFGVAADFWNPKVRVTLDGTMVIGFNTGAYDAEIGRAIIGYTEATENQGSEPIYELSGTIHSPTLSGRAVYFNAPGDKLLKVYAKGPSDLKVKNFCVGVVGGGV